MHICHKGAGTRERAVPIAILSRDPPRNEQRQGQSGEDSESPEGKP